ncbi:hypothetical protein [Nostoc sp.]|uniref:hypothetical protein n=1 Tax=Nostoc sp. TaxID=1180 RepID=UPI002A67CEC5|nr:hypothetical protein [Nostoc sp. S13]
MMLGQEALSLVYPEIILFSIKMEFNVIFYSYGISRAITLSGKVCELLTLSFPTTERRSHWSQLRETESRYIRRGEPNELD